MALVALGMFTFVSGYLVFPKALAQAPLAFYRARALRIYPMFLGASYAIQRTYDHWLKNILRRRINRGSSLVTEAL